MAHGEPSLCRAPTDHERGQWLIERVHFLEQDGRHFAPLPSRLTENSGLYLLHGVAQALADEVERIAVGRHSLGEAFELRRCLEAVLFASLDGQHAFYQLIRGGDEQVIALAGNRGPESHRHRQGDWTGIEDANRLRRSAAYRE